MTHHLEEPPTSPNGRFELIDISCPISNGMWSYREDWQNEITQLVSTNAGDASSAYRFDLCSHTGTYIETSQHKLKTSLVLDDFGLDKFIRPCTVICLKEKLPSEPITKSEVEGLLKVTPVEPRGALLIATGWGERHQESNYLRQCPFFEERLTDFLCDLNLGLLGVDVPVIDHPTVPYQAIARLFLSTPNLLVLAPLVINLQQVVSGRYTLSALPLNVKGTCASLCRPVLMRGFSS